MTKEEIKELKHTAAEVFDSKKRLENELMEVNARIEIACDSPDKEIADLYEKVVIAKEMVLVSKDRLQEAKELAELSKE